MHLGRAIPSAALAAILAGCQAFSPTPKVATPYAADTIAYVDARLGYAYATANPSEVFEKEFAKLKRLYMASDACDEIARKAYTITINDEPLDKSLGEGARKVDKGDANCPRIYLDFFETAAEISDTACDEFIDRLWFKQRDLRLASDYTNIASGAASAAVGLFSLGSVIGSLVGLSTVALNEAFKSSATNLLFSLDAGEVRSLIYKQKSLVRQKIDESNGIDRMSEAKVRIRDYFLACTPASISEYVSNIIAEAAKSGKEVGFLGTGAGSRASRQAAIATIVNIGEEVGPYLGTGSAMPPKEVAALFAVQSPEILTGDDKDELFKRAVAHLSAAGIVMADGKDYIYEGTKLAKRRKEIKKQHPDLSDDDVTKRAKAGIRTDVVIRLERLRLYSGLGQLVREYLSALPATPEPPAPADEEGETPPAEEEGPTVLVPQPVPDENAIISPAPETLSPLVVPETEVPDVGSDMNPGIFFDE